MHPNMDDQCVVGMVNSGVDMVPGSTIHDLQDANAEAVPMNTQPPPKYPDSPPNSSLSVAEQCIVCLEDLDIVSDSIVQSTHNSKGVADSTTIPYPGNSEDTQPVAIIKACGHSLHDECLREWIQKANSCPFCRQTFHLVEVLDKIGGTVINEYEVEDKKQVAATDFDPAWIEDIDEEEESVPCPICARADNEDVLLLCDACNAPYHTYCMNLPRVPTGRWFCIECQDDGAEDRAMELSEANPRLHFAQQAAPRTQGSVRRNRRRIREDHWYGAWSVFSNRVHDAVGLDLDFSDQDDDSINNNLRTYRQIQRRTHSEQREFRTWQQRLDIASRQGAREAFQAVPRPRPRPTRARTPPSPKETKEESKAWGAFEKAKELDGAPKSRKRKSRSEASSVTASPAHDSEEPFAEPERKLKRPRTRRVLTQGESSSSASVNQTFQSRNPGSHQVSPVNRPEIDTNPGPSFLSSLLKEVEMGQVSDEDTSRSAFSATTNSAGHLVTSPSVEYSSPAASPSPSTSHTPRPSSITPPPHITKRHPSPRPLSSHVEPAYPRADYSPNRSPGESRRESDRESSPTTELRQPRPRRQKPKPLALHMSPDTSPVRATMSAQAKDGINRIVKSALAPHWKSAEITKEQYADINRDVSRKLYEIVADRDVSEEREKWEKMATGEVARAVQGTKV